jgi:hypothetical protein
VGLNLKTNIVRLLDRLLISFQDSEPEEQHLLGFNLAAFSSYLGRSTLDVSPVKLARGGVTGGSRAYLEVAAAVFDVIVRDTLQSGHMGTDKSILRYAADDDDNDDDGDALDDVDERHRCRRRSLPSI